MKRFIAAAAIIVVVLSAVFTQGCEKKDAAITVALDWYINTNHAGLYVALEKGYYKDAGLTVDIQEPGENLSSSDVVAQGSAQIGVSYQEQVTFARTATNPQPIVAVAAILQHNTAAFSSPANKNITSPLDFMDKTYGGYGAPIEEAFLKALLQKHSGDFSRVNIVNLGMNDFFTAIETNVDISMIYCGWTDIEAKSKGIELNNILLRDEDERLDFYTPILITSEAFIEESPEDLRAFLEATAKGYEYCAQNPEEAAQILHKYSPEADLDMLVESMKYLSGNLTADGKFGVMKKEVWDALSDFCVEYGVIEKALDSSAAFTNDYLPK